MSVVALYIDVGMVLIADFFQRVAYLFHLAAFKEQIIAKAYKMKFAADFLQCLT